MKPGTTIVLIILLPILLPIVGAAELEAAGQAKVIISIEGATLRLVHGSEQVVFPVGVGRRSRGSQASLVGVWFTGADPGDRRFYTPSRKEPAFHRGLPFLRLNARRKGNSRQPEYLFGIHGPVTPTLIWGTVSAGCIRMRPADIQRLYTVARKIPTMMVRIIPGRDRVRGRVVKITPARRIMDPRCPEAADGIRRLRRIHVGRQVHERLCGGLDHWYAIELQGGDVLSVKLKHDGPLKVELFGIRAISAVASGASGFEYRVPKAARNRGKRYLRISSTRPTTRLLPYNLEVAGL